VVEAKLVGARRGGYCFEQNICLKGALEAAGFAVAPHLARIRLGRAAHVETPFTHLTLVVRVPGSSNDAYLADAGAGGLGLMPPIRLPDDEQSSADGDSALDYVVAAPGGASFYRTAPFSLMRPALRYRVLQRRFTAVKGGATCASNASFKAAAAAASNTGGIPNAAAASVESEEGWQDVYTFSWRPPRAPLLPSDGGSPFAPASAALECDVLVANWWSCTHPTARFVSSLFVAMPIGDSCHSITNQYYTIRNQDGKSTRGVIKDRAELLSLLTTVFGMAIPEGEASGIDRYLNAP